jgi:hypothetical protein
MSLKRKAENFEVNTPGKRFYYHLSKSKLIPFPEEINTKLTNNELSYSEVVRGSDLLISLMYEKDELVIEIGHKEYAVRLTKKELDNIHSMFSNESKLIEQMCAYSI